MLSDYAQWLCDTAHDIGLTFGDQITPHSEIKAWSAMSGIELSGWEVQTIRAISGAYLSGLRKFAEEDAERPYVTEASSARVAQEFSMRRRSTYRG